MLVLCFARKDHTSDVTPPAIVCRALPCGCDHWRTEFAQCPCRALLGGCDHGRTEFAQLSNDHCSVHLLVVTHEMLLSNLPRLRRELVASLRVVPHVLVEALHTLVNPDYLSVVSYVL